MSMNAPRYCPACDVKWTKSRYKTLTDAMWQCDTCHEIIDFRPEVVIEDRELAAMLIEHGHAVVR